MKNRIIISALMVMAMLFAIHEVTGTQSMPQQPPLGQQAWQQSPAGSSENFQLDWQVLSCGATDGSSASFSMLGTLGQPFTGYGESESFGLSQGFWQEPDGGGTSCCLIRADINHDGSPDPDIADLIYMVTYMFQEGPEPPCDEPGTGGCVDHYFAETDINGDGTCTPDIADLIYLVTFMFQEGPAPVPCP